MKILVAETAGFCWGVRRALDQAVDLSKKTDGPVQTFGPLIHNAQVMEELTEQNIHAFEQPQEVTGGTVLVRPMAYVRKPLINSARRAPMSTTQPVRSFVKCRKSSPNMAGITTTLSLSVTIITPKSWASQATPQRAVLW